MSKERFKKGDTVKIIKDFDVEDKSSGVYKDSFMSCLIESVGRIGIVAGETGGYRPYYIKFNGGFNTYYSDEEIRKATEQESDKFYLERYKYV